MNHNTTLCIGERIKKLRLEAHLTQNELADGVVTRNMLSMIESGKTLPSLDTLLELCRRLGVSPGYIFADRGEEMMYRKDSVIDRIRTLFGEKRYDEVISLSQGLEDDAEIAFYVATSYLDEGMNVFKTAPNEALKFHFERACVLSENRPFQQYVKNTVDLAKLLAEHAGDRRIPSELCDPDRFTPCAFLQELFAYLAAMRFLEFGDFSSADAIVRSGLLVSDNYRLHVQGAVLEGRGESESALELFVRASEVPSSGFYSLLRLYTDIELCAQKLGEYKLAYDYSSKHISLIESIRK